MDPPKRRGARAQTQRFKRIKTFVHDLETCNNIVVIAGAGISVSCGIPDFRSKGTGLYNSLDCQKIGIPSPELLFDYGYFKIDPSPFYKFASSLLPNDDIQPSISHRFISMLEQRQKLLRCYTQNVDGLERRAGITKVIECHGSMAEFFCLSCKKRRKLDHILAKDIREGKVISCGECHRGILKPAITFFGENVPRVFEKAMKKDVAECDLVIVMGTSLKVGGSVQELLNRINPKVPRVLLNRDAVNSTNASFAVNFSLSLLGNCDCTVQYLSYRLQWKIPPPDVKTELVCSSLDDIGDPNFVSAATNPSDCISNAMIESEVVEKNTETDIRDSSEFSPLQNKAVAADEISSEISTICPDPGTIELEHDFGSQSKLDSTNAISSSFSENIVVTDVAGPAVDVTNISKFGRQRKSRFTAEELTSGCVATMESSDPKKKTTPAASANDPTASKPIYIENPSESSWALSEHSKLVFSVCYANESMPIITGLDSSKKRKKQTQRLSKVVKKTRK